MMTSVLMPEIAIIVVVGNSPNELGGRLFRVELYYVGMYRVFPDVPPVISRKFFF